jgi:hypothetical protein
LAVLVSGCARGASESVTADAPISVDARRVDATVDGAPDSAPDAGCAINAGITPALDGVGDLADYPESQQVALGAMLGVDGAAIAWDANALYVTVTSDAFLDGFQPLHIYIEATTDLGAPMKSQGKEYGGLVPTLAFTPTHLIAARRISDSGTGAYDGVLLPAQSWTSRAISFTSGVDMFVSSDNRTISTKTPWSVLGGCPTHLRLSAHVVHGVAGNEWKDLIPSTTTPWLASGGGYYEIDLTAPPAVATWSMF